MVLVNQLVFQALNCIRQQHFLIHTQRTRSFNSTVHQWRIQMGYIHREKNIGFQKSQVWLASIQVYSNQQYREDTHLRLPWWELKEALYYKNNNNYYNILNHSRQCLQIESGLYLPWNWTLAVRKIRNFLLRR